MLLYNEKGIPQRVILQLLYEFFPNQSETQPDSCTLKWHGCEYTSLWEQATFRNTSYYIVLGDFLILHGKTSTGCFKNLACSQKYTYSHATTLRVPSCLRMNWALNFP